jgi:cyclase
MSVRIIPRLDIKGPNLVKGIHLEGLRVLGKPERFARFYYEQGADELIYMDAVASLYGRNSLLPIIEKTAKDIFIPLTVGGGLRTVADIRTVLRAGADKVAINTAAVLRPELIREAALRFGSSTIVLQIDAMKKSDGTYEVYTDYGRQATGVDVLEWSRRVCELGAGEILATSIQQEGSGAGYDVELIRQIAESVPIPVIAAGGAGRKEHVLDAIAKGKADAVSVASLFHYHVIKLPENRNGDFKDEGNTEFLKKGNNGSSRISDVDLAELKRFLMERGVICRN